MANTWQISVKGLPLPIKLVLLLLGFLFVSCFSLVLFCFDCDYYTEEEEAFQSNTLDWTRNQKQISQFQLMIHGLEQQFNLILCFVIDEGVIWKMNVGVNLVRI